MKSLLLFSALIFWGCGTEIEENLIYHESQIYSEDSLETYHPVDGEVSESRTWHDDFIEDSCARCPECCVIIDESEEASDFYEPTFEDRSAEEVFCTADLCPGINCLCVLDSKGVWWLDATRAGTDDEEQNQFQ